MVRGLGYRREDGPLLEEEAHVVHRKAVLQEGRQALEDLLDLTGSFLSGTTGPVVVTGDFNATPWTPPVRRLMAETGLRCAPGALAGTYPAALLGRMVPPWLAIPIDIVLAGGGAHAVGRRRGPAIGSDHWPVVIELILADRGDFKPTA